VCWGSERHNTQTKPNQTKPQTNSTQTNPNQTKTKPEFLDLLNSPAPTARGAGSEPVGCSSANTGLVAALAAAGVRALYCGHDHDNDFVGEVLVGGRTAFRLGYGWVGGWGVGGGGVGKGVRGWGLKSARLDQQPRR